MDQAEPLAVLAELDERRLFLPEPEVEARPLAARLEVTGVLREHPTEMQSDKHQTDSDDREIQAPNLHRSRRHKDSERCGDGAGERQPHPDRETKTTLTALLEQTDLLMERHTCLPFVAAAAQRNRRVRTDAHEERMAERYLTGDPDEDVDAERRNGERQHVGDRIDPGRPEEELGDRTDVRRPQSHQYKKDTERDHRALLGIGRKDRCVLFVRGPQQRSVERHVRPSGSQEYRTGRRASQGA